MKRNITVLGFKHILACPCEYTYWVEAIPIANEKFTYFNKIHNIIFDTTGGGVWWAVKN